MELKVTDVIRREVVAKVLGSEGQVNPERIPVSLLKGLHDLVKAT
jgi:hypothetical protein